MTAKSCFWNQETRVRLGLALGIFLFIGLGMFLMPQKQAIYPAYATESPSPTGVKAFFTLLEKNISVATWKKPSLALPLMSSRQLMIMVAPSTPLNSNEIEQWTQWLETGNQLWLLDRNPKGLFNLHTSPINQEISQETTPLTTVWGSKEWEGTYHATLETNVRLVAESKDQILLKDQHGVVALSRSYGKGDLMVLLAPEWVTNGIILQHDHLQLVLPFLLRADPKVIWFNDFVHRNINLPTALSVYPQWFLILLTQVALSFLLWLWYKGKRFGSVQIPRESAVRFGDERIRATASWYERGKFYKASLSIQAEFLRHTVQERWGIPTNLTDSEFIEAALQRIPADKQQQWLQHWRGLKDAYTNKISLQTYLTWSKRLDDMQKEVEHR